MCPDVDDTAVLLLQCVFFAMSAAIETSWLGFFDVVLDGMFGVDSLWALIMKQILILHCLIILLTTNFTDL